MKMKMKMKNSFVLLVIATFALSSAFAACGTEETGACNATVAEASNVTLTEGSNPTLTEENDPTWIDASNMTLPEQSTNNVTVTEDSSRSLYGGVAWLDGFVDKNVMDIDRPHSVEDLRNLVQFFLYNSRNDPGHYEATRVKNRPLLRSFNTNLPTKIVIHGWRNNAWSKVCQNIKNAYLKFQDVNVICVDWSSSSTLAYHHSKAATINVAVVVAEFIDRLVWEFKYPISKVHIIGHSLGAHTSGMAARNVKSGRIPRITGLDPADPLYDMRILNQRLGPDAADFVEIIHTGGKRLGTRIPLGHVDLYPNGGDAVQRGCGNDWSGKCSHERSHEIYQESIRSPNAFVGFACASWDSFRSGKCLNNAKYVIGENANTKARGIYYFKTANQPPLGLGLKWQTFSNKAIMFDKMYQNWASKLFGWVV